MSRLFFNKSLKKYYLYSTDLEPLCCNSCKKVFENGDSLIYQRKWNRNQGERLLWCERCFKKGTPAIVEEYLIVYLTGIVPQGSILVMGSKPDMQPSKLSVFQLADLQDEVKVNNHCKVSIQANRNMMPALEAQARPDLAKLDDMSVLSLVLDADPVQEDTKRLALKPNHPLQQG